MRPRLRTLHAAEVKDVTISQSVQEAGGIKQNRCPFRGGTQTQAVIASGSPGRGRPIFRHDEPFRLG
jgi:hypothetical protein